VVKTKKHLSTSRNILIQYHKTQPKSQNVSAKYYSNVMTVERNKLLENALNSNYNLMVASSELIFTLFCI